MFQVNTSSGSKGRPSLRPDGAFGKTFGMSVDESEALRLLRKGLHSKHHATRIGIEIQGRRGKFIRGEEQMDNVPVLWNDEEFVLMSPLVDLSPIGSTYTRDLRGGLQAKLSSLAAVEICILTGEMASLEVVQLLFDHAFKKFGLASSVVLPNFDNPINASRGAVELALGGVDIEETFEYRLELLVDSEYDKDEFLMLFKI
jgi:hypothetical protein